MWITLSDLNILFHSVRFPEEEENELDSYYPHNHYPPVQTICTDLPHYKKLSDRVNKMFEEFETKLLKMEMEVSMQIIFCYIYEVKGDFLV